MSNVIMSGIIAVIIFLSCKASVNPFFNHLVVIILSILISDYIIGKTK